jgi:hypothetical protein
VRRGADAHQRTTSPVEAQTKPQEAAACFTFSQATAAVRLKHAHAIKLSTSGAVTAVFEALFCACPLPHFARAVFESAERDLGLVGSGTQHSRTTSVPSTAGLEESFQQDGQSQVFGVRHKRRNPSASARPRGGLPHRSTPRRDHCPARPSLGSRWRPYAADPAAGCRASLESKVICLACPFPHAALP